MAKKPDGALRGYRLLDLYSEAVDPQPGEDGHLSALVRAMGDLMLVARDMNVAPADLVTQVKFGMELRGLDTSEFE